MQNRLEPIFQKIIGLMEKNKEGAFAVFDFDNTCIFNDIAEATLAYLAANDLFKDKKLINNKTESYSKGIFDYYYTLLDDGKVEEAYEFSAEMLSGFTEPEVESLASEVIKFEGEDIKTAELFGRKIARGIKLRKNIVKLINFLKTNNIKVWIITASPEILVRATLKYFNIDVDVIGVRNNIINGKISTELEEPLSILEGKVDCIKKFIDQNKKPLIGVGDSINDLPMLEYCKIRVVVDRQNTLVKKAKQNGWFLI